MLTFLFTLKTAHWTLHIDEGMVLVLLIISWWYTFLTILMMAGVVLVHSLFMYERNEWFWEWYNRARSNWVFRILPKVKITLDDDDTRES